MPFSIGAAPPSPLASRATQQQRRGGEGGGGTVGAAVAVEEGLEGSGEWEEEDDEPLGNLPPSRGGVSMAGF